MSGREVQRPGRRPPEWAVLAAWLFVLGSIWLHLRIASQVWGSDLAGMDDPAHYTTGVMVYDYLRTGLFTDPMAFARDFYVRFPKVALGHWPPVYYAVQAVWYGATGPSIGSARVLSLAICAVLAGVVFRRVRRTHGSMIAAASAGCLLALPALQANSWRVMSDVLVALLMLLAAMTFADFMEAPRARPAGAFAMWAVLAVLTKGSGWALGIFAFLAPLMARRWSCYRSRWYWGAGAMVAAVCVPFYVMTQRLQVGYADSPAHALSAAIGIATRLRIAAGGWKMAPVLILLAGLGGGAAAVRRRSTTECAALALMVSQAVFLAILPMTEEGRYYLPSVAALMVLFAGGLALIGRRSVVLLLTAVCFAECGVVSVSPVQGYRAAVDSIPYEGRGTVILVGSDAEGEGTFIAERLEHDRAEAGLVLRGSKVLARSTWAGDNYRLLFRDAREVLGYLRSVPVHYVVVDAAAQPLPHREFLEEAVQLAPEEFVLTGRFATSGARSGEVRIYENRAARGRPSTVRLEVGSRLVEKRVD